MLDWGDGLQLYIPASEFQGKTTDMQLILSYTLDYTDYSAFQFFYGDWSTMPPFIVGGVTYQGQLDSLTVYGIGSGTVQVTACSFAAEQLAILQQRGLVIQGHGMRLTKMAIAMPTAINDVKVTTVDDNRLFLPDGRQISQPQPRQLYIKNGKKYVEH